MRPLTAYAQDYRHGALEPAHRHRCAQLIHTLSGIVRVDTDAGTWIIPPGRGVWVPAETTHALKMNGQVRMRTLFVDSLARADLPGDCCVVEVGDLLKALIVAAIDIAPDYAPGGRAERVMELILDELRILPVLGLNLPDVVSPALLTLCHEVHRQLHEAWSLERAAELLGVSERTVSRRFQRETGLTFSEWLRRKRLLEALEALAAGHSVLDVALAVGYDSQSAFSAMFRRCLGVSPSTYLGS
ncbi:helix-turn-helix transcriptional regulator [Zobellella sp. DQSA1]|uniref:AraC family transcriptional regulator n=1 Tax=Zobellella sp. DQSA1 TaxID=3342386 RepID=UPI0035C189F4